ncbi:LysE family translocator [Aestuariibacter sp. A3R04]|uniref:LysE family translocator n=1 Tax=Aestuariibacter sp. A3R04 TaxID=2841571 RepID=UPI001C088AEC|nr:LysE family translocator [Aestuariibacter sp. A3R04]MBU3023437.1 LysE family translocator [Aestuariibacter sp. A3R04]
MEWHNLGLMVAFAASMTFSPGPANLTLLGTSVQLGVKSTVPLLFGIVAGFLANALAICIGLGGLFQRFPAAVLAIKVLGTLYILYLAWGLWKVRYAEVGKSQPSAPGFFKGLLVHPLNPKAWMMLITAYSQFVSPETVVTDSVQLIVVFCVSGFLANGSWMVLGSVIHEYLQVPRMRYGIFTSLAIMLIGLSVALWLT